MDLTGKRFGKLTVIGKAAPGKFGSRWLCKCDCDNSHTVYYSNLRPNSSCGCARDYHHFKIPVTNTTGVRGVHPFVRKGILKGYRASLFVNGKTINGKVRATVENAAEDRKEMELEYLDNK